MVFSLLGVTLAGMRPGDTSARQSVAEESEQLLLVLGAEGEPIYGEQFLQWAELWKESAQSSGRTVHLIGHPAAPPLAGDDRDALREELLHLASLPSKAPLWVVFIGHGTYNGRIAKFNLRGPDVSPLELAEWCKAARRPLVIALCFSCSGAFLKDLSAPNRIVISSTRSGTEIYFSRFGKYFAEAIADPQADLDKDEQISVFESFLLASRRTEEFYRNEARLATEHALLDDNGDGIGTEAADFRGYRPKKNPRNKNPDGTAARNRYWLSSETQTLSSAELEELQKWEAAIEELRERKASMQEDEYYEILEKLLLEWIKKHPPTKSSQSGENIFSPRS